MKTPKPSAKNAGLAGGQSPKTPASSAKKSRAKTPSGSGVKEGSGVKKSSKKKEALVAAGEEDFGDDGSVFMAVPSFDGGGAELDFGGDGPAWKTYDWEAETSARQKKKAKAAAAAAAATAAAADDGAEESKGGKKAPSPATADKKSKRKLGGSGDGGGDDDKSGVEGEGEGAGGASAGGKATDAKAGKVDMRFGSEWDKQQQRDAALEDRREAKRQKYAALNAAADAADGTGGGDDTDGDGAGTISGKVLGRRRRAAEKRSRAAELRRAERTAAGLPVDTPQRTLPGAPATLSHHLPT
jgi:ribosomal RNA-processing protein 8